MPEAGRKDTDLARSWRALSIVEQSWRSVCTHVLLFWFMVACYRSKEKYRGNWGSEATVPSCSQPLLDNTGLISCLDRSSPSPLPWELHHHRRATAATLTFCWCWKPCCQDQADGLSWTAWLCLELFLWLCAAFPLTPGPGNRRPQ